VDTTNRRREHPDHPRVWHQRGPHHRRGFSDHLLFESESPTIAVYQGVLSANLQVRILVYGYFAFTFARYPKSTSIISGVGLVPPPF
jgi:hypothetical protein